MSCWYLVSGCPNHNIKVGCKSPTYSRWNNPTIPNDREPTTSGRSTLVDIQNSPEVNWIFNPSNHLTNFHPTLNPQPNLTQFLYLVGGFFTNPLEKYVPSVKLDQIFPRETSRWKWKWTQNLWFLPPPRYIGIVFLCIFGLTFQGSTPSPTNVPWQVTCAELDPRFRPTELQLLGVTSEFPGVEVLGIRRSCGGSAMVVPEADLTHLSINSLTKNLKNDFSNPFRGNISDK